MKKEELKVLMISSDRKILELGSAVGERMKTYGSLVEELHIVLLSTSTHNLKETKLSENVWIHPTNSFSRWRYPANAASVGKRVVYEHKFVRGKSVITTQDPFECGLAGLKVKRKWRIPLEVQLHTDPFSPYFSGFLNYLRKRISKKVLKHADSVRVVSKSVGDKLVLNGLVEKSRVEVLPIYIDKKEDGQMLFDLHAKFGWRFVLLMVCRLTPEKEVETALKALVLVLQSYPSCGLVIVGSGPKQKELEKLAKTLQIQGNVVFVGWQENLTSYYKTSNVFIQTSVFEGYGLALVEAGISGLPVVTTPVGLAQEFQNGKEAYIYKQGDAQTLAAAVVDLLENNFKRENLRVNMKHFLDENLLSQDQYLNNLSRRWEAIAINVTKI